MGKENVTPNDGVNRAKMYQLALFPMNNGATNVYFVLILSYIATFGNTVLAIAMMFATTMITVMRVFDAVTDPIIGALMDRTNGKFGKFRPFMVLGNLIMAFSAFMLYCITPMISEDMMWLRYIAFVGLYMIWVIGYTFQTSVTRSAQSVLTNDPKQRPLFTIFNTIGSMAGMGLMQVLAPVLRSAIGDYDTPDFYMFFAPIGIVISIVLTILAVIGIWEKDNAKYFGIGGKQEAVKPSEYVAIIKANKPMQRLMVAGGTCKLALSIATNMTVLCMLYGCMMGNYDGLYLPMMVLGYVFSAPFFALTVSTSQKKGQKASLQKYVGVALACYVVVLVLLIMWEPGNPARNLSIMGPDGLSLNLYTIVFILFFGLGYGAYYSTADMPIPMVADCADYETYRSGKYIPGIMGTLFSLVDKLVSSLAATVVGVAVSIIGLENLPVAETPYSEGMNWVVIALFCIVPMVAWAITLLAMRGYELSGPRMKEIQAINNARKALVANGMSLEDAMAKIQTVEDIK
ncbi:MAG: MFS transporter [Agathobacter sp.]|nr:MFS transporter [Agathobacter sp.]